MSSYSERAPPYLPNSQSTLRTMSLFAPCDPFSPSPRLKITQRANHSVQLTRPFLPLDTSPTKNTLSCQCSIPPLHFLTHIKTNQESRINNQLRFSEMAAPESDNPPPWHTAYPAPKSTPDALPRQNLLQWFREGKQAGRDFVLVDVRRTDFEVCLFLYRQ